MGRTQAQHTQRGPRAPGTVTHPRLPVHGTRWHRAAGNHEAIWYKAGTCAVLSQHSASRCLPSRREREEHKPAVMPAQLCPQTPTGDTRHPARGRDSQEPSPHHGHHGPRNCGWCTVWMDPRLAAPSGEAVSRVISRVGPHGRHSQRHSQHRGEQRRGAARPGVGVAGSEQRRALGPWRLVDGACWVGGMLRSHHCAQEATQPPAQLQVASTSHGANTPQVGNLACPCSCQLGCQLDPQFSKGHTCDGHQCWIPPGAS